MKTPAFFTRSILTRAIWGLRRDFGAVALFSAVSNLLMLVPTIYMLQIYSYYMMSRSDLTLIAISLIALFLLGVMAFTEWTRSRLLVRLGVKFDEELNSRVFDASFEAHLDQARDNPVQAFTDLIQIRQFVTGNGILAFLDAPWIPIYLFVMFVLNFWLGMLSVVFAGALAALAYLSQRMARAPTENATQAALRTNTYLHGKLRNAEVVESLGMLANLRKRWLARHEEQLAAEGEAQDMSHRIQALTKLVRYSQQSLMLGAGAWLVIRGEFTVGAMVAASVLMSRALAPLDIVTGSWSSWITARTAFGRLERLLEEHAGKPAREASAASAESIGDIRVENLVATAPKRLEPILKGLTAEFPAGGITAIIGPSGSGKTTFARCLIGIWPEESGRVLLGGRPVGSWDRDTLGPHIGYLPQDIEMFEGTIAENIARFRDVEPEKVIEAAQRSGIHDMILRFPEGYDTPMGEAGALLSGGQRQRIGLARALYGNPELIVLDEPNANLDEAGEISLLKAMLDLKAQGKTIFLITHRLHIINVVDRILVLQDGRIDRYGPRQQVLAALRPPSPEPNPAGGAAQPA